MLRLLCVTCLMLGLFAANPSVLANSSSGTYRDAVQRAYDLIRDAKPPATEAATRAAGVLGAATGRDQPEIQADLAARPPDYEDARARLQALMAALEEPGATADPALAKQRLHEVMAQSRFDALHRPPSPLEQLLQWVRDRLLELYRALFGSGGGPSIPIQVFYFLIATVLVVAAVLIFRSTRGRFIEAIRQSAPIGPRPPADYFAQADRLAAKGDRVGAIRALCAGVAASLAGEQTWEGSPLTVREIFQRAPDYASLRPLLVPFEAAVYGGRVVDQSTYERAARAAEPYRQKVAEAA